MVVIEDRDHRMEAEAGVVREEVGVDTEETVDTVPTDPRGEVDMIAIHQATEIDDLPAAVDHHTVDLTAMETIELNNSSAAVDGEVYFAERKRK